MCLEILAIKVKLDPNVHEIMCNFKETKIALYAVLF